MRMIIRMRARFNCECDSDCGSENGRDIPSYIAKCPPEVMVLAMPICFYFCANPSSRTGGANKHFVINIRAAISCMFSFCVGKRGRIPRYVYCVMKTSTIVFSKVLFIARMFTTWRIFVIWVSLRTARYRHKADSR